MEVGVGVMEVEGLTAGVVEDLEVVDVEAVASAAVVVTMIKLHQLIQYLSEVFPQTLQKMILHNSSAQSELSRWTGEPTSQRYSSTQTERPGHRRESAQLPMMIPVLLRVLYSGSMVKK